MGILLRLVVVVSLTVSAASGAGAQQRAPEQPIGQFFDAFTDAWMRFHTDFAASARYFTGEEQDRVERMLMPQTRDVALQRIALAKKGLADLRRYDRSKLSPQERVLANLMEWQLDMVVKGEPFLDLTFPLEQFGGANINLVNTLTVQHVLRSEKDAQNYLARLALIGPRVQEAVVEARAAGAKGIRPPKFILEATINQMKQFIGGQPAENPLAGTFNDRLRAGKVVSDARRAELAQEAQRIIAATVYPAWQEGIKVLEEQLPAANDNAGISNLPNGDKAYGIEPSEVERYVVMPGQATSYMIGQLRIYELREKARKALGPKFSLRAFHNAVLGAGALPLSLMETEVDAYIAANR